MFKVLISLLLFISPNRISTVDPQPGFASLSKAVSFIVSCLDAKEPSRLQSATLRRKIYGFESLEYSHGQIPLTKRYLGREFPSKGDSFKLGGHDMELGHVHIDFVKRNGQWFIDSIWVCR